MPYYIPKSRFREVGRPKFRNSCWENWGLKEGLIGAALAFLGLVISITEIVRIIYGVTNRGLSNYLSSDNPNYAVKHDSNLYRVTDPITRRVEKFHYWPWSYAANLFGLVAIFAGASGIVSAFRRSYSTVFTFMSLSLLSALFSGFLVAYYSVLVNYYINYKLNRAVNRPGTMHTTWGLIGFNLAVSIAMVVLGFLGFLTGFCGIRGCSRKGLHLDESQPAYVEPSGPRGRIIARNYMK